MGHGAALIQKFKYQHKNFRLYVCFWGADFSDNTRDTMALYLKRSNRGRDWGLPGPICIFIFSAYNYYRNEEYVKPKAVRKAFQGSGQMLGSIAPQVSLEPLVTVGRRCPKDMTFTDPDNVTKHSLSKALCEACLRLFPVLFLFTNFFHCPLSFH
jgi:hypothetical protein